MDFIKIDVEGAELPALQGAQVLLRRADKPMLIVEFEEERQQALGVSCATLAAFLTSHDYALFRIGSLPLERYVIGPNEPQSVNVLGLPEAQVAAVFKTLATEEPLRRAKLGAGAGGQMLTG